ncbi:hypothetical protein LK09_00850 [Microbacterium mangrovi]|uniref:Exosortase/archaeosortase family protein n=1 Tax=Microbacterium mangrovi TaxID=1348253 RepID=A0A0B2ADL9_9MICO|nr:exosortase/archaeosortase family protein [Microbacterium mangrovi]KHK99912.1 hypothetical protein LK09_00850 [Microbacterium mangrovi]
MTAQPITRRAARMRQPRWLTGGRVLRLLGATATIVVVGVLLAHERATRAAEAWLAEGWLDRTVPHGVELWGERLILQLPEPTHQGLPARVALEITAQCASYVAVVPLLVLFALILGLTRVSWARWGAAALIGVAGMLLTNQIRLWMIAASTAAWGMDPGYTLSHGFVGSAFGIIGFAAFAVLSLALLDPRLIGRGRRTRREHAHD